MGETREGDRPDSGYGWIVALASFLAHVQCLGTLYTFTLYVLPYQREFGMSAASAALPSSLATGLMLVCSPFIGLSIDRFDPRGVFFTLALCQSGGLLLVSLAETPLLLVAAHVPMGVGMALAPATVTSCLQWFDKKRALATGIGLSGSGMGQFVLAQVIRSLVRSDGGENNLRSWRLAMRAQAMLGLVLLVPCALALRKPRFLIGSAPQAPKNQPPKVHPSPPPLPAAAAPPVVASPPAVRIPVCQLARTR
jgi:MFS family permease